MPGPSAHPGIDIPQTDLLRRMLPLLILALAAGFRLFNLTWSSLDGDEGASLYLSSLPFGKLIRNFATAQLDPHPLGYYLLLKIWRALTGDSDLALRLLSALAGILMIGLVYRLARAFFSRRVALAASLLAALNPLLVAESQDARMYTVGPALGLAGLWALAGYLRSSEQHGEGRLFVAGLFCWLAAGTHLSNSIFLPAAGVLTLALWRRSPSRAGWALGGVGLAVLLSLPYLHSARQSPGGFGALENSVFNWASYFQQASQWLMVGRGPLSPPVQWALTGSVALALAAGLLARYPLRWWSLALVLPPLAALIYVNLQRGELQPKSLTGVSVLFSIGLGLGFDGMRRAARLPALAALLGALLLHGYGLSYLWRDGYQRDDWRSAAQFVADHASSSDVTLVHLSWYRSVFDHYFRGPGRVASPWGSLIRSEPEVTAGMGDLLDAEVIWLAQSGQERTDPERQVENWLLGRFPEVTEVFPHGITLRGFAVGYRTSTLPLSATPTGLTYPGGLRLVGFRVPLSRLPTTDRWLHPPSSWVHVTLYWQVDRPAEGDLRIRVTLEDEAGNEWGEDLFRPNDLLGFYPPRRWQPGEVVRQDVDVNANPEAPPGEYKLVLWVSRLPDGQPLRTENGSGPEWHILQSVELIRPPY